ncbi:MULTISPECIES: hypothetical protein [Aliiglaciecola]|uniref:hypothetical protein n=1 Tax=Aliiglaciecola TaxID=1406885 RepID=UPI001C08DCBA|nr:MULTISPECIES: hypothetical protein [Aliiglaciecola]MBU2880162.1 hypothetical protein [Aliiglaciecola lipolytica]MDO6710842.1 hypothetical protein [Aliiglaciecola sp. 2_MG-2023]MDO6752323.1 hypothetical protein [Aliiglaciecola sp. 1_MG-2023]
MENKAYQIVKGKNCNAADVATFLDNIKQALMLVWDDFDRLKVTPNNYDLNYIVNDLALTQFKESVTGSKKIVLLIY